MGREGEGGKHGKRRGMEGEEREGGGRKKNQMS